MKLITTALAAGILLAAGTFAIEVSAQVPEYKPPMRGAPASRVGGGTRGVGDDSPRVIVLSPDHTGLTVSEQPSLYFFVSRPAKAKLEVTVINDQSVQPLLEKDLPSATGPGIHRLSLKDYNVSLKPGIEYRWFVGLVVDEKQRSNDVVASGTIQRVEPSEKLKGAAAGAPRYALLASEGIWYDAIDELSRAIEASPGDAGLRRGRAALLEQVGLEEIAKFERSR
jgi:hypothetical protein